MKVNEKEFFGDVYPWYRWIFLTIMITLLIGEIAAYYFGVTDRLRFDFLGYVAVTIIIISAMLRWLYVIIRKLFKKKKEGDV